MLAQSPTFRNPFVIAESSAAGYKGSLPRGITNGIHANKVHLLFTRITIAVA